MSESKLCDLHICIFSGGSGANSVVESFLNLSPHVTFVLPISDNGGSTSEIIRFVGGPAIGDLRSRLVRLIDTNNAEDALLRELLGYRLPSDGSDARHEWFEICRGTHQVIRNLRSDKRQLVRSFLIYIEGELMKRALKTSPFNYAAGSVGNLFLTGARLFSGSLESSIELMTCLANIPESISVLPIINTNFSHHIAARLKDGQTINGQNQISHPSNLNLHSLTFIDPHIEEESSELPNVLSDLELSSIAERKGKYLPLSSPIEELFYINSYGCPIYPKPNSRVIKSIMEANMIIYSIGSLYTSIVPCLIPQGVGEAIRDAAGAKYKILLLNGINDRETGPCPYSAANYIETLVKACNLNCWTDVVTHLIYLDPNTDGPPVEPEFLQSKGITLVPMPGNGRLYDPDELTKALKRCISNIPNTGTN